MAMKFNAIAKLAASLLAIIFIQCNTTRNIPSDQQGDQGKPKINQEAQQRTEIVIRIRGGSGYAEIYLDGYLVSDADLRYQNTREVSLSVSSGEHTIAVSADGYRREQKKILVLETRLQNFYFELKETEQ